MYTVDFHMHTTCSDGTLRPEELFDHIRAAKLDLFSVTDHDTMSAYPMPEDLRARNVMGMEVDSELRGSTVHILVYGLHYENELIHTLQVQRDNRFKRAQEILASLHTMGIELSMADVESHSKGARSIGRPHIARALISKGYVKDISEAFDKYLAEDQPGYVALERLSAAQVIEFAHKCGAIASIAHPARLKASTDIDLLADMGVDGIEVNHPSADAELRAKLKAFARDHNLLETGGSDFHTPESASLGIPFDRADAERFQEALAARKI
ncbi:MAG: PHP domain-containing protein [Vulcanimicrobiaceae bacterium]